VPQNWEAPAFALVPELGLRVDQSREGLVPRTLKPLLARRMAYKQRLATLDRRDVRYRPLKDRSDALKWLLVVSFGYLGYKNARFGRIESHESVTAYGREALLRAKEAAEDLGYVVLHMYVDGLWVRRPGKRTAADLQPLLDEVRSRTGLPIALEGIYRWIFFLSSRLDERVPVANRYFGLMRDGRFKVRGIEARRRDTPRFIAQVQTELLKRLARVPEDCPLEQSLDDLLPFLRRCLEGLKAGKVGAERLLVAQTLSRSLDAYRQPSPAARAAAQLERIGKTVRPGQKVRFLHTLGHPGVWAWDLPAAPNPGSIDLNLYARLLIRAASTITGPLGIDEKELSRLLSDQARQVHFRF
jgi:DNA polymerase-2